jgi:hypothetical protein
MLQELPLRDTRREIRWLQIFKKSLDLSPSLSLSPPLSSLELESRFPQLKIQTSSKTRQILVRSEDILPGVLQRVIEDGWRRASTIEDINFFQH